MTLIYPWESDKFKGSVHIKREVISDLQLKYRDAYRSIAKAKPNARLLKAVKWAAGNVIEMQECGEVPWAMVVSNSTELLQSLATIVPCVVSLTMRAKVFTVETSEMLELFMQRRPSDPFDVDPVGESIGKVTRCGHLAWTEFGAAHRGAEKFEGSFHSLLNHRVKQKTQTLFLAPYADVDAATADVILDKVMKQVGQYYGPSVAGIVGEFVKVKIYRVQRKMIDLSMEVL